MNNIELQERQKVKDASNPKLNIWINASAGSGKTTVLVKRLVRIFLEGTEPSKVLCITFTKAGAIEMKQRINKKLRELVLKNEEDLENILKDEYDVSEKDLEKKKIEIRQLFTKVLDRNNSINIVTIHSYCEQILRQFPLEAGVVPGFKILSENNMEKNELLNTAIVNVLNKIDNESFKKIFKSFSYKNIEENIETMIEKSHVFEEEDFSLDSIKEEIRTIFFEGEDKIKNIFLKNNCLIRNENEIEKEIEDLDKQMFSKDFIKMLKTNINDIKYFNKSNGNAKDIDKFYSKDFDNNEPNEEECTIYKNLFLTGEKEKKDINKLFSKDGHQKIDNELKEKFEEESKRVWELFETLKDKTYELIATKNYNLSICLLNIFYDIYHEYNKLKKQQGYLDFSDLIIKTKQLLQEDDMLKWINYKLDLNLEHILVDEAQDTNSLQWDIIKCLTNDFFSGDGREEAWKRTIFVVGDEKQAIFGFQDSDPKNFFENMDYYKKQLNKDKFKNISLDTSYRSLQNVINFVNAFIDVLNLKNDNSFSEQEHSADRKKNGKVEFINVLNADEEKKSDLVANDIVEKIEYLIKNGKIYDTDSNREEKIRSIEPRDIMILFNKLKGFDFELASKICRKLNNKKIPNTGVNRESFLNHIISQDIISFLSFILFTSDDLSLANIVKSPILNLSEEDLYELAKYKIQNKCSFLNSFNEMEKYEIYGTYLNNCIKQSNIVSIHSFLFNLFNNININNTSIIDRFRNRFSPSIVDEIINKFLSLAEEYENSYANSSLLGFLDYLNKSEFGIKKEVNDNINEIRISTIHSSKGAEAPIIIIANISSKTQKNNEYYIQDYYDELSAKDINKKKIILSMGIQSKYNDYNNNPLKDIFDVNRQKKRNDEDKRLKYVAFTRAKNELYIYNIGKESEKEGKKEDKEDDKNKDTWENICIDTMKKLKEKYNKTIICKSYRLDEQLRWIEVTNSNDVKTETKEEKDKGGQNKKEIKKEIYTLAGEDLDNNEVNIENKKDKEEIIDYNECKEIFSLINKEDEINNNEIEEINPSTYYSDDFLFAKRKDAKQDKQVKEKGISIHRLLEILPLIQEDRKRNEIIDFYLDTNSQKEEIKNSILEIFKEYGDLFGKFSKAEVPVTGIVKVDGKNKIVTGVIDRLAIIDNVVKIVDYKTGKQKTKIPSNYIRQLELYKSVISNMYKDKQIEAYILWTDTAKIVKLDI